MRYKKITEPILIKASIAKGKDYYIPFAIGYSKLNPCQKAIINDLQSQGARFIKGYTQYANVLGFQISNLRKAFLQLVDLGIVGIESIKLYDKSLKEVYLLFGWQDAIIEYGKR